MARIYAPVKDYNGISAGVSFRDGVGECSSPYLLKWFHEHGYKVEETQELVEDDEKPEETKVFEENAAQEESDVVEENKKKKPKAKRIGGII